jgi:quinolinate synthase
MLTERKQAQVKRILELKESLSAQIYAHYYQRAEVKMLSDFVGGTRAILSKLRTTDAKVVVICAVTFVSVGAIRLRPDIKVLVPRKDALCPFSESVGIKELKALRSFFPEAKIIGGLKADVGILDKCDKILESEDGFLKETNRHKAINGKKSILLPGLEGLEDFMLSGAGEFMSSKRAKESIINSIFPKGFPQCQIHAQIEEEEILRVKERYPKATVIVNVLSNIKVKEQADFVGDTDGIFGFIGKSEAEEFIVVAESGLIESLGISFPKKKFYELETEMFCPNMKLTNIKDILYALEASNEDTRLLGVKNNAYPKGAFHEEIEGNDLFR